MKTPDEIKKGLECCLASREYRDCIGCSYGEAKKRGTPPCDCEVKRDVFAYIQQLENHIGELTEMVQQLERERDAAVRDLTEIGNACGTCCGCKHWDEKHPNACDRFLDGMDCWEWRGVQEVST